MFAAPRLLWTLRVLNLTTRVQLLYVVNALRGAKVAVQGHDRPGRHQDEAAALLRSVRWEGEVCVVAHRRRVRVVHRHLRHGVEALVVTSNAYYQES
eukprot:1176508-Prorocentrum_minimum.AAC.2